MDVAVQIQKKRSKFLGVRQRPSGKWVAEIKNTTKKIRMWLGTFTTAEEAARAYDEAACLLRGSNTRTNFGPNHRLSHNSPLSLKIRNLLHQKHTQQKHSLPLPTTANTAPLPPPQSTIQVPFIYNWNATSPSDAQIQVFDDAYRPDLSDCLLGFDQLPFTHDHYHPQETETNAGFQSGFGEVQQVTTEFEIERASSSCSYSYLDNAYLFSQTW